MRRLRAYPFCTTDLRRDHLLRDLPPPLAAWAKGGVAPPAATHDHRGGEALGERPWAWAVWAASGWEEAEPAATEEDKILARLLGLKEDHPVATVTNTSAG